MAEYVTPSGHVVLYDDEVTLPGKLSIGSHGYAQCWSNGTVVPFHRWLLGLTKGDGLVGDHINRVVLDCRRENLRAVTPAESNLNRVIAQRDLPVGVSRASRSPRFTAVLKRNTITRHLGTFDTPEEAAEARARALAAA